MRSSRPWKRTFRRASIDLNNSSALSIADYLMQADPLRAGTDARQQYNSQANAIVNFRDNARGRRSKFVR